MDKTKEKNKRRQRRRYHVRNKLRGSADYPRMTVCRSLKHISCQLIDDISGKTLAAASTYEKGFGAGYGGNSEAAAAVGKLIAERAKAAGISKVRLDRGHAKYHGRVAALADAAREGGLQV